MKVTASELCDFYGVDRRTVTNWLNSTPPCPSSMRKRKREFDSVEVAKWHAENAARKALAEAGKSDGDELERRREYANTRVAEIKLAELEGDLIPLDDFRKLLSATAERVAGVLKAVPSKYHSRMKIARSDVEVQGALEAMRDEALAALQGAADDLDIEDAEKVA